MVASVVTSNMLQRVPRKCVAAVVVNGLDCRAREKPHALSGGHGGELECDTSAKGVEEESLEWMVVERTEGVGNIKPMMARVKGY